MQNFFVFLVLCVCFISCNNSQQSANNKESVEENSFDKEEYIDKGIEIAAYSQGAIGGALQKAMKEGGVPNALDICNVKALPITDSLAKHHNIVLKRVSEKNRNPENMANSQDLEVLADFKVQIEEDGAAMPTVVKHNDDIVFYYPILTMTKCMNCHGQVGTEIQEDHYEQILSLYPNDKAIGYEPGELRGAFKMVFN